MRKLLLVFITVSFAIVSSSLDSFSLLRQYLEKEKKLSYMGKQMQLVYTPKGYLKFEAIVKQAYPGRTRLEFLSPSPFSGYVMVWGEEGGAVIPPKGARMPFHRPLPERNLTDIHLELLSKSAKISLMGEEKVMERKAIVFLIKPAYVKGGYLKLWVDKETGIRLRTERYSPSGQLLFSISLVSLQLKPSFKEEDFRIPSFGEKPRNYSLEELKNLLRFRPLIPSYIPPGYKIVHQRPFFMGKRRGILIHLTDGLNPITILEAPNLHRHHNLPPPIQQEIVFLKIEGYSIFLTGNVDREVLEKIGYSLR
jgi:outer membrane lipoprotein-sorting protein